MNKYLIILVVLSIISCRSEKEHPFVIEEYSVTKEYSGEPNLFTNEIGETALSWVEFENDSTDVLKFSMFEGNKWSKATEISRGNNWFVNWADFPSIIKDKNGLMTAHWLQKSDQGTYDYDVRIAQSADEGASWSSSIIPHKDSVAAEHGFVSLVPTPDGNSFAVWLDGRNTKKEQNNAMTLRSAIITNSGEVLDEVELDDRVCDCCQTSTTWTDKGPIVVYRDRSEDEIRDIAIVQMDEGIWTAPRTLYKNNWKIAGCPVNGPAIESLDNLVVVAWFTMDQNEPEVWLIMSYDYGKNFGEPIRLDESRTMGRIDLTILNSDKIAVSWMEETLDSAAVKLCVLNRKGDKIKSGKLFDVSADRSSGFSRITSTNDELLIAWTSSLDSSTIVKSGKIRMDEKE